MEKLLKPASYYKSIRPENYERNEAERKAKEAAKEAAKAAKRSSTQRHGEYVNTYTSRQVNR